MELSERIKTIREHLKVGNQEEFSNVTKIPLSRVKDLERGKVKALKSDEAIFLEEKFHFSGWWLLTGKGDMLLQEENNLPSTQESFSEDENAISLNFYPEIAAAAGYGAINDNVYDKQIMKFDRTFLEEVLNVRRFDRLDVIKIVGDSMEPFIQDGQIVIIERNSNAMNGETVIANVNGEIYVKRYHADPFGEWINLVSDNKIYGSISLDTPEKLSCFSIVGIVRAKIKAF